MIDQQQTDVSKLSDAELMALIGQQPQAQPATPQQSASVTQGPGEGLGNPYQQPIPVQVQELPDISQPRDQQPVDFLDEMDKKVRALARGVPVAGAFADEANAAILAGVAPTLEPLLKNTPFYDEKSAIGDLPTYKERYNAALNLQRFRDEAYDIQHPKESLALRGLGAVGGSIAALPALAAGSGALPASAGLIPRMAVGGLEGAAIGGAQGYGEGAGDYNDPSRIAGAVKGGALGGGAGVVLPAALSAGGALWKGTGQKVADMLRGAKAPISAPKTESEAIAAALRGEAPSTAVDAPLSRDLAEVIANQKEVPVPKVAPSAQDDALARIAQALERQKQTPDEMVSAVQGLGPRGMIADTGDAMRTLTRDVYNRPGSGADILSKALRLRQEGQLVDGEFVTRPSSSRILDEAASGLGVDGKSAFGEMENLVASRKAAAGPAYAKAYEAPPVDIGEMRDFVGTPLFNQAYQRARAISEKEFVPLPDGGEGIVPLPERVTNNEALDWRTLDLMKQGLDDLIREGKVQGIGANEQGAIKGYLSRFVQKLDSLNPDYKAAREAFAGPTAMMDALEAGRSALREDAPALGKTLAGMTESERQMYRLGALQGLKDKLGNADVTYDAARQAGVLKPNQLERFKELFPDRESFAKFANTLSKEQEMFRTRSAVLGNSTTAKQLAAMQDQNDNVLETVGEGIMDAKTGNLMGVIRALGRVGAPDKLSEPTAEALASILTNTDQEQLPLIAKQIAEAQKRKALADAVRAGSEKATVSAAASGGYRRGPDGAIEVDINQSTNPEFLAEQLKRKKGQ